MIKKKINDLLVLEKNLERFANRAVVENQDAVLFLLQEEQLRNSIMSDGSVLGKKYAKSTQEYWRYVNPPRVEQFDTKVTSERYNFDWSGEFFNSMRLKFDKDGFDIKSPKEKKVALNTKNKEFMALTKENNDFVNDEIVTPYLFDKLIDTLIK